MNGFLDTLLYPLEWVVARIMVRLPHRAGVHRADRGLRLDLGAVDRRPGDRRADPADPAVRQADPRLPADAADPAGDAEDPEEVQGQERPGVPSGDDAGDDGPLQAHRAPTRSARACRSCCSRRSSSRCSACSTTCRHIADGAHAADRPDHASAVAAQVEQSTIFGAQLSATLHRRPTDLNVKILTVVLIMLMSATTFTTQRQLMRKNMPAAALDNPFAKQQKVLLYLMPIFFAISGINFPIGVLLYWLTTNLWSMGQQFYVIRRMPAPGSAGREGARGAPDEARQGAQEVHHPGAGTTRTGRRRPGRRRPSAPSRSGPAPAAQAQEAQPSRPAADRHEARPAPGAPSAPERSTRPAATARPPAGTSEPRGRPADRRRASPPAWETPHPTPIRVPTADVRHPHPPGDAHE